MSGSTVAIKRMISLASNDGLLPETTTTAVLAAKARRTNVDNLDIGSIFEMHTLYRKRRL